MFTLDIEINTTALKDIFGRDAHTAYLKFSEKMLTYYENIEVSVSPGPLTRVEGLNSTHMFDEYGDVAQIIDELMLNIYQLHFSQQVKWFPDSFCEFSTGNLSDHQREQIISDWKPGWDDHA